MIIVTSGLQPFVGVHRIRIFADERREKQLMGLDKARWKSLYAVASLAGFGLLIWGFGIGHSDALTLWVPPEAMPQLVAALTVPPFVLLAAAHASGGARSVTRWYSGPASGRLRICWRTQCWPMPRHLADSGYGGPRTWLPRAPETAQPAPTTGWSLSPASWRQSALVLLLGLHFAAYGRAWLIGVQPLGQ